MIKPEDCNDEKLTLYHFDELTPDQRLIFEAHLEKCDSCRSLLVELRASLEAVPRPAPNLSGPERQKFVSHVMAQTRPRSSGRLMAWGGSLTAAGALAVTLILLQPGGPTAPRPSSGPALVEFEVLEQLDLLQDFDLLQNLDFLKEIGDLG